MSQFSLDIFQIQYWESLLANPGVLDHAHTKGLIHINVFMYAQPHAKTHLNNSAHS